MSTHRVSYCTRASYNEISPLITKIWRHAKKILDLAVTARRHTRIHKPFTVYWRRWKAKR